MDPRRVVWIIVTITTALMVVMTMSGGEFVSGADPGIFPPTIGGAGSVRVSPEEIISLREKVREMFYHGYNSYLTYAFPRK